MLLHEVHARAYVKGREGERRQHQEQFDKLRRTPSGRIIDSISHEAANVSWKLCFAQERKRLNMQERAQIFLGREGQVTCKKLISPDGKYRRIRT
jgi:hypothetical protein